MRNPEDRFHLEMQSSFRVLDSAPFRGDRPRGNDGEERQGWRGWQALSCLCHLPGPCITWRARLGLTFYNVR